MAYNRGTRHKPKWVGRAEYRGHARWVGTHASLEAYREAERQCLDRLREEVDSAGSPTIPTVLEFAKAVIHDSGHIEMEWPDGQRVHKATGRKDSSVRRLRDGLRPFLREFGPRPIDSFTRREALAWVRPKGANTLQSVRQFFNHALDNDLVPANHFSRVGASKRKRRVDRHDFQIITDKQYELLRRSARQSRTDDYGLVLEGALLAVGEAAMRPSEVFALHRDEIDFTDNVIHVRWQLATSSRSPTCTSACDITTWPARPAAPPAAPVPARHAALWQKISHGLLDAADPER